MIRTGAFTNGGGTSSHPWGFHNPVKIVVGRDCRKCLVQEIKGLNLLAITSERGRRQVISDPYLSQVISNNTISWVSSIKENPGIEDLQAHINSLKGQTFDALLAIGGGSAMDAAKVLAVALSPSIAASSIRDLIDNPQSYSKADMPDLYAIPTTAGTGSEVTPFATVWDHAAKKKLSMAGPKLFPKVAIVDAALTDALPIHISISTGLDSINQAFESIWNKNATPITFAYASRSLELSLRALPLLVRGEAGESVRDELAEASVLAGLAISNTRTALCHSISYPITAHFGVPHGIACAFTMLEVLKLNALEDDGRLDRLAYILSGVAEKSRLFPIVEELVRVLKVVPSVKDKVQDLDQLLQMRREMLTPGRADNNLSDRIDLQEILERSWHSR